MPELQVNPKSCGGRQFGEFAFSTTWPALHDHALRLRGATISAFFSDEAETWLLFVVDDFEFCLRNQDGKLYLSVDNPKCPDLILQRVLHHFSSLVSQHLGD